MSSKFAKVMKFVLDKVTASGVRLGRIAIEPKEATELSVLELETPLCLVHTRSGSVPCLTPDIVAQLSLPPAIQLSLATLYEQPGTEVLHVFEKGLHRFLRQERQLQYLSVYDPHKPPPPGYNDKTSISVWCLGGRKKITVADHMKFIEVSQPDIFEALFDSASSQDSQLKRIRKSVDRTLKFLDDTLERKESFKTCSVLGAVVGGDEQDERQRSARETALRDVDGFVIAGFDQPHSKETLRSIIGGVTALLPQDKPRFVHNLHTPSDIFTALECGVDVFDSSYSWSAAEKSCALVYPFGTLQRTDTGIMELDLSQAQYKDDLAPICAGCSCYGCTHHSRAYIHHLLTTKELLGRILLMIHNLSHLFNFFQHLSAAIKTGEYENFRSICLK